MNMISLLGEELQRENAATAKLLQCIPDGKTDWKPHDKSFTLGRLATHTAELMHWMQFILGQDEFDLMSRPAPRVCATTAELTEMFAAASREAMAALQAAPEEKLWTTWKLKAGDRMISNDTRYNTIRQWMISHQVHHRGQLSVYLRLLDVPIPGMYGPSADDMIARQQAAAVNA